MSLSFWQGCGILKTILSKGKLSKMKGTGRRRGVRDNGEIETPQQNLDDVEKKFNRQMEKVYPRIAYVPKIVTDNGRQALAVIIPGSELRQHFAGLSYVRRGSESIWTCPQK